MANLGADNQLGGYANVGYSMSGQAVDLSRDDLASGYYLYDTNPEDSACPNEMRAGLMVIRGAGTVNTCNGRIFQENLPDIYLVDYRFKAIIRLMLMATAVMLIIKIIAR